MRDLRPEPCRENEPLRQISRLPRLPGVQVYKADYGKNAGPLSEVRQRDFKAQEQARLRLLRV